MSEHILNVIYRAKREQRSPHECLAFYQMGLELSWWKVLDLRDIIFIQSCTNWEDLLAGFKAMEPKYRALWSIAGCPPDQESWLRQADAFREGGAEYWNVYHTNVNYGRKVVANVPMVHI